MSAPLLSVVMPTHDRPDLLARAAQSVLTQQVGAIELVVVDDASGEETQVVTEQLAADPRVRVVRNERSVGPGLARNQGIGAARGDLLGFCDDDDLWLPGAAEVLLGRLEADRDLGMVTAWHRVVHDATGRRVDYRGAVGFGAEELLWFNFVALPFGVIRRAHYPGDVLFDPLLYTCEDWDVWLRCATTRPVAMVPEILYEYHQHGGERVTKAASLHHDSRLAFLEKHEAEMTPSCTAYHRAVIELERGGRSELAGWLAAAFPAAPLATLGAASVLGGWYAASAVGRRQADPGLASRVMFSLLRGGLGRHPRLRRR